MTHTCRGTVNLAGAFIDPIDVTHFVVSNGKSQVYHLRAVNEKEKQCWMTALSLAKAKAIKSMESGQLMWLLKCVCISRLVHRSLRSVSYAQIEHSI